MTYFRFFLAHPRILCFGILLTLFSSFGQTFLISIFVPRILEEFGLDAGRFGVLYSAATILSALSLPFFGRLIDRADLQRYTLGVGCGLVAACFVVSFAPNIWILLLGIVGLRLTGQGLLGLTASTTMARLFESTRGKALSVSSLGYPLGEGLLPLVVVLLIHSVGWRASWAILGVIIIITLLPLTRPLLSGVPSAGASFGDRSNREKGIAKFSDKNGAVRSPFRDWRFYAVLPGTLLLPFALTGLFLYQLALADFKNWSAEIMAGAFIGFAVARLASSLVTGPLIDRFRAAGLFAIYLLPFTAGLGVLILGKGSWAALVYLSLAGVTQGMGSPIITALWAEMYGVRRLGAIKGVVSTLGVLSTAVGPLVVGVLLGASVSFTWMLPGFALVFGLASFLNLILSPALRASSRKPRS